MKKRHWFNQNSAAFYGLLIGLVGLLGFRLFLLNAYPLLHPSEGRYAEIARQMLATGNWVTPHLENGVPFRAKPPLFFWQTAINYLIFGVNEFSARFASYYSSLFIAWLVYLCGKKLYGSKGALASVLVLFSTALYFLASGWALLDTALAAGTTLSMAAFFLTLRAESTRQRVFWGYAFFVGLALGLLAKGFVAWILIGFPVLVWTLYYRKWRAVWSQFPWLSGTLLMLAIGVPWHVLVEFDTPGFLRYYIIVEHFGRFLDSSWNSPLFGHGNGHPYPYGSIFLLFLIDTLPWNIFLFAALIWLYRAKNLSRSQLRNNPWIGFLIIWTLSPLVFFTFSANILFTYVLPAIPSFALLTVAALHKVKTSLQLPGFAAGSQGRPARNPWFLKTPVLGFTCVLITVIILSMLPFSKHILKKHYAQKKIANYFLKTKIHPDSTLYYIQDEGHTVSFYTNGLTKTLGRYPQNKRSIVQIISKEIRDSNNDFYIFDVDGQEDLPKIALQNSREIGRFYDFSLREDN